MRQILNLFGAAICLGLAGVNGWRFANHVATTSLFTLFSAIFGGVVGLVLLVFAFKPETNR